MLSKGLSSDQVKINRTRYGSNTNSRSKNAGWSILLDIVKEPMLVLLIVCCAVYFVTGEKSEGWIMLAAICIVSGISLFQQIRSENAIKELNKLTSSSTKVIRNGEEIQIPSDEIVIGDLIFTSEGNIVPADARILEVNDLSADESLLTGESLPVLKTINDIIYSGTTLTSGLSWAEVIAVGKETKIGKLGTSLIEIKKEKTPLQVQISKFVTRMALVGVVAFGFVWLYNYIATKEIIHSLLHGLTLAMAVLPEEIPVALSTFMALGAYHMIKNHVLTRQPQTVEALGAATVICVDKTGTITENKMSVAGWYDHHLKQQISVSDKPVSSNVLLFAMLASEDIPFDPMEKAIHESYNSLNSNVGIYTKTDEYPLSGTPPLMTHVFTNENGKRIIAAKGAPEGILALCKMSDTDTATIHEQIKHFASLGMRVLGVSEGMWTEEKLPAHQNQIPMNFIGLIALSDPMRSNIPSVISHFYDAGIEVKMITGDYRETAMSIAKSAGIKNNESCINGDDLVKMPDEQFNEAVKTNTVFSRVLPEIKLKIINSLKAGGEVVAMTGDGVNDAPALKAAHIGIAMGKRGSEVARQASSLVLLNDDLGGMVKAVEYGRNIYANLKKAIQYIISIHIPLIMVVTLPLILGWKYPNTFSPIHVIFLELIMGPTCSIVFENEPNDPLLMKIKPRKMSSTFFTWKELSMSIVQGMVITMALLGVLAVAIQQGMSEDKSRTLVFTTLVLSNILLTLTGRSGQLSILKTIRYKNILVPLIAGTTLMLLAATILIPSVMQLFAFDYLSALEILICMAVAIIAVLWVEFSKKVVG
ncbi:MAG TPA: cation-translocating P-type ATPase [Bacteroidia bacterium]|nr:cation-translocating P-type ATPase [Bacteroidia bacterium]